MARRTTHRSSKGKKLYAVRDAGGKFKDIQTYKRAHGQDIKRKSAAELKAAAKKKTPKRAAAKKAVAKKSAAKKTVARRAVAKKGVARKAVTRRAAAKKK